MSTQNQIQLKDLVINVGEIKSAAKVIRSINHPFRLDILKAINDAGTITVTDLWVQLRVEQSECSQGLAIMRKEGILLTERSGKNILYSINYTRLNYIVELIGKLK